MLFLKNKNKQKLSKTLGINSLHKSYFVNKIFLISNNFFDFVNVKK